MICFAFEAKADHITGGEMFYSLAGTANGEIQYNVTLKLYMRCNSGRQFNNPTFVSIFDRESGSRVRDVSVAVARIDRISITNPDPCITNPPPVCYEVGYYEFNVSLPPSFAGYKLVSQVNFRIANIKNLTPGYTQIGAAYTAEIPGNSTNLNYPQNSGAHFTGNDLVVVCANNSFSYSFAASDSDGDQLRYSFCEAYRSGSTANNAAPPSATLEPVPYASEYNGSSPLGSSVKINEQTGLITGIAPSTGIYVVTVCVQEIRNGIAIATQRKDLQINIAPCNIAAAILEPEYILCRDTKAITVSNLSNSPLIKTYQWEFLSGNGTSIYNTTDATASYTFPDTGIYTIKLAINKGEGCSDSTSAIARVYPGFAPEFNFNGICFKKPTIFTDASTSVFGTTNKWSWDFGESTASDDTSNEKDATYTYPINGTKTVSLIVGNTVGCRDTLYRSIAIVDKPPLTVAFKDTLICVNDPVTLRAIGNGIFNWTPNINIINRNTSTPTAYPASTQKYYVNLDDNGCLNKDSVLVRVTDHVNLTAMSDTTICQGDTIVLRTSSNGFKYLWSPTPPLNDPTLKEPRAITIQTTIYEVTAFIGSCSAKEQVAVTTVPYPFSYAGRDTVICFNSFAVLNGITNGSSFSWSPATSLSSAKVLNPVATPSKTTSYILSAHDTKGCPKPGTDTVIVEVLPRIQAFAGNDTSVVIGQPLQLNATGGVKYTWSPLTGLSASGIPNPVGIYTQPSEGIKYKVLVYNEAGCVDSTYINVKVFSTGPTIFVPTAFTPNKDGKNDLLRPIASGMKQIESFSIFNRWGQLIFRTQSNGPGWDGTMQGIPQGAGVFVWMVKAIDYTNKPYFEKGTVTLIR